MLFPNTFSTEVRKYGERFTLRNILSVMPKTLGVYIFYYKRTFVYVGQSESIRDRLRSHYNESHNEGLAVWLEALDGDVQFTHIKCCRAQVDDLERSLILYLQPVANRDRFQGYLPERTEWRKTHA